MEIEGLELLLASERPRTAQAVLDNVMSEVHKRSGDSLVDDIAIVVLRKTDCAGKG